jgi:hypothetical protein
MDVVDNMLDLTRRLPPNNIENNIAALVDLRPEYADELLGSVDQPLQVRTCATTGRDYLICDYNRDGDSYMCVARSKACARMTKNNRHWPDLRGLANTTHPCSMAHNHPKS